MTQAPSTSARPGPNASLLAALGWVDLTIFAEVQRMRARGRALAKDAPWGAYIGEAEVDEALGDLLDIGPFRLDDDVASGLRDLLDTKRSALLAARREARDAALAASDVTSGDTAPGAPPSDVATSPEHSPGLAHLARAFHLDDADLDLLLLALAPEVNARYVRLFAYLQDDFSAQHLTPSLALRLLSDARDERIRLSSRFAPDAPLLRHGLLVLGEPAEGQLLPVQARPLAVNPRIARWLLQGERWDPDLHPWARLEVGEGLGHPARKAVAASVDGLLDAMPEGSTAPLIQLGDRSRRDVLEAGRHLARRLNTPLVTVDLAAAATLGIRAEAVGPALVREARLQDAVLLVLDPPEPEDDVDPLAPLVLAAEGFARPLLLQGEMTSSREALGLRRRIIALGLPGLDLKERELAWRNILLGLSSISADAARGLVSLDADQLARRYRYSPGQIAQVIDAATNRATGRGSAWPHADDVLSACADTFLPEPGPLAERLPVRRGWDDLVVPEDTQSLLHELVSQVERREQVLEALGGARVRPGERGIKALFAGPPGTGKTLSAEVLAHSLGYPLFRVDLASVVSKWVGETEKHLGRLFAAAEDSPCVLLFDEADALFGKRAEVKGAQDRFANLEVSYLLQRLESFDGIAILTTNLKRNIDEAFLRRFTFVVDFPFPETAERYRIWQRVLSDRFPLAEGVSLESVATEFKLAGANIWNVAVAAACEAAAADHGRITRQMLAHAVRREYQKLGRQVQALRPTLLAGGSNEPDSEITKKRAGRPAMSAAEARRVREEQGAGAGEGAAEPRRGPGRGSRGRR